MSKPNFTPEQQRAITEINGKMIVSASAGSGKTTVMIERICQVVKSGVGIDKIVALTFTEASARDMKAKLERRISDLAMEDTKYLTELEKVPFVDMCTVDSLCRRVVAEYFEIAGVDPAFGIIDKGEAEEFSKRAFQKVLAQRQDSETFFELQKLFEKQDRLKQSFEHTCEFLSALPDANEWLEKVALTAYTPQTLDNLIARKIQRFAREAGDLIDLAQKFTDAVKDLPCVDVRLSYLNEIKEATCLPVFGGEVRLPSVVEKQVNTVTGDFLGVKAWCEDAKKLIYTARDFVCTPVSAETERIAREYVDSLKAYIAELDDIKCAENKFSFADIERKAFCVLSDESVRERVLQKYSYVFVDEYQDINELQAALIDRLTKENKFMVGDVKQSIYMFRHAEPAIFINTMNEGVATPVLLMDNFRSAKGVISSVNDVFARLMGKASGVEYEKNPMKASAPYEEGEMPAVSLDVFEKAEEESQRPPVYSVREDAGKVKTKEEVLHAADLISDLIKCGKIYDPALGKERGVQGGDIAVIVRSRKDFYFDLANELRQRGTPVSVDLTRSDAPEIKVLIDLIKLLDNADQDVPTASVMLTMFGFSEEELVALARRDVSFATAVRQSADARVVDFNQKIARLRFLAGYKHVDAVLKEAVRVSGFESKLDATSAQNIERMIQKVGSMALNESIVKFLAGYEKMQDEVVSAPPAGDNAVQMMTMHASKGLEFPIVLLGGLGSEFVGADEKGNFMLSKAYGIVFKNVDRASKKKSENTANSLTREEEKIRLAHDRVRLLYVAMTRAKNNLFMSATAGKKRLSPNPPEKALSFVQMLGYAQTAGEFELPRAAQPRGENNGEEERAQCATVDVDALRRAMEFRYPHAAAATTRVKFAVTALAKSEDDTVHTHTIYDDDVMRIGTLHHKVMEEIDFAVRDPGGVKKAVDKMVELHTISQADAKDVDLDVIARALNADVLRQAEGNPNVRREYKFMLSVPGAELGISATQDEVLVQGVIDLLIPTKDGVIIVDYKHTSASGDELIERYAKQLDLYARAVEYGLETKVIKKVILSLKTGKETEV